MLNKVTIIDGQIQNIEPLLLSFDVDIPDGYKPYWNGVSLDILPAQEVIDLVNKEQEALSAARIKALDEVIASESDVDTVVVQDTITSVDTKVKKK